MQRVAFPRQLESYRVCTHSRYNTSSGLQEDDYDDNPNIIILLNETGSGNKKTLETNSFWSIAESLLSLVVSAACHHKKRTSWIKRKTENKLLQHP
jgi:hypothetical protein